MTCEKMTYGKAIDTIEHIEKRRCGGMRDLKVKKHISYTYETSDGQKFDDKKEATKWQEHLYNIEDMCVLDSEYKPTKKIESAFYVYAKTSEQAESFNAIQIENGYGALLLSAGFYRYDSISDSYVEIETEIAKLQHIIDMLKGGEDNA